MSGALPSLADLSPAIVMDITGDAIPEVEPDGTVVIDTDGGPTITVREDDDDDDDGFDENLAEKMDPAALAAVASELIREIQDDDRARRDWLSMRETGIAMLGLKIEEPRGDIGSTTAPLEGMATYRSPELLQAVLRAQATARGELLPADGPVKVTDQDGVPMGGRDGRADILEQRMNAYLTRICPEYYPDTDSLIFWTVFGGTGFKKGYHCPLRRRPVLEQIDAADIICSPGASDLKSAMRVTHRIRMKESDVKRMMAGGFFRDTQLTQPQQDMDTFLEKKSDAMGVTAMPQQPKDMMRTIYEVNCERVIPDSRRPKGFPEDIPLPYRITIDKDSMTVLSWRRRWDKHDEMAMGELDLIRYAYVEGMGIYAIGLVHIIGNSTRALTAATREMLDAGMFASFPGFIYSESIARQLTNEFRVPPGGGIKVQSPGNTSLSNHIIPLPYKDVSPSLMQLIQHVEQNTEKLAGTAELPTGEGSSQMPVGTVLAMIDQSTKPLDAVHKRLHAAQAEEFQLLKRLLKEDPGAVNRHMDNDTWTEAEFKAALDDFDLVPVADPNVPTHTHRLLKGAVLKQLSMMAPQVYDQKAVDTHILHLLGFTDVDQFFAPPAPPGGQDPAAQAAQAMLQAKMADTQAKIQIAQQKAEGEKQKLGFEMQKAALEGQQKDKELQAKQQMEQEAVSADLQTEKMKVGADMAMEATKALHPPAPPPAPELDPNKVLDAHMQEREMQHTAMEGQAQRSHEAGEAERSRTHEHHEANRARAAEATEAEASRRATAEEGDKARKAQASAAKAKPRATRKQ